MNEQTYNINDYHNGFQNNQRILIGDSSDKDDLFIYFITAVIGTDVTISDKDSNALFTVTDFNFSHPVRLDGGFESSGTDNVVIYYAMPKGIS